MDNKHWSGYAAFFSSKMRGDEWRFQCKVLRELEEQTDIPGVIRRVGESPEQYPEIDEEWMEDLPETEDMSL